MQLAVMRIMFLNLLRDRGALAMSFLLPGLVYVIFAGIFAGAASGDVKIRLALFDERQDKASVTLANAVLAHPAVLRVQGSDSAEAVRQLVKSGSADVAAVIRDNGTSFDDLLAGKDSPVLIIYDPFREISVKLLEGIIQESYFSAIPAATIRLVSGIIEGAFFEFEPAQKQMLDQGLQMIEDTDDAGLELGSVFSLQSAGGESSLPAGVSYYAGAVAMLFLLFSSLNGSMSILEDRETGIFDRVTLGKGGVPAYMQGKFLFLCAQGLCEVTLIFTVAWLVFGVDVPAHFMRWLVISIAAACCAAGLGVFFVSCCRSRQQAQSLGNIITLVISALGGSMVPRFLMPESVQSLGWMTPNTWVLEAYSQVFWRQTNDTALYLPVGLLAATGFMGIIVAIAIQRKRTSS